MLKFNKTVDYKPIITDVNENQIIDLTQGSLKNEDFLFVDIIQCPEDFAMRPELIAELKMGDQNKLEILLKSNEISNPFSVDAGDVIVIPDPITSENKFSMTLDETSNRNIILRQYLDPNKELIKNTGDSYDAYAEREKTMLPPNYAKSNDKELLFENGNIILGPNVTRDKLENTETALSKLKIIEKIKNG